jgi:hypothetical protein
MSDAAVTAGPQFSRPGYLTLPRLCWILSLALGAIVWACERHWYSGALAALSLWIVVGLGAQMHDLWANCPRSGALPVEERWGWRFAVGWRLAIACLISLCFVIHVLIATRFLLLDDERGIYLSAAQVCRAVLLTALIVATASSPRLAPRPARRPWSWVGDILRFTLAAILAAAVVRERLLVVNLVHVTIAVIGMAQPRDLCEGFASSNPRDFAHLFAVATAGIVAVLVSCGLLWLLARCWWRGRAQRVSIAVLLVASLAVMIAIAGRIGLVELPRISPLMAAQITMPKFGLLVLAAMLVLLLVTAAARRWSEPLPSDSAVASIPWRRDERRYYHERRLVIVLLAAVAFLPVLATLSDTWHLLDGWPISIWGRIREELAALVEFPEACLSLVLVFLAIQSVSSRRPQIPEAAANDPPGLAPGLFLVNWFALLAIVVFAAPILGTWGFAYWFNR